MLPRTHMDPRSALRDPARMMLIIAVLVKRLGGSAKITQADIDDVAFNFLQEDGDIPDNSITLFLRERSKSS